MGLFREVVISMDIEIEINRWNESSYFDPSTNSIGLGYEYIFLETYFTSKEFDTLIADTLKHEFLHGLLTNMFQNDTISHLFDTIEHLFCNIRLKDKYVNGYNEHTGRDYALWHDIITLYGIQKFYSDYQLDNDKLNQAYIITGGK